MQAFQLPTGLVAFRRHLTFDPDGRTLAVGHNHLTLIDTATGAMRTLDELAGLWNFEFVNGGATMAGALHSEIRVLDLATGQLRSRRFESSVYALAAAPGADRMFVSVFDRSPKSLLRAVSAADLEDRVKFDGSDDVAHLLAVSADGRRLAASTGLALRVWDVGGPALPTRAVTKELSANGFAFAANERLAVAHANGVVLWDARTGAEVFRSGKHRRGVTAVACHPSREVLATGDSAGKVFVWDHGGRVLSRFEWGLEQVAGLAFAPDGLRCAAVDTHGKVVVWDVDL